MTDPWNTSEGSDPWNPIAAVPTRNVPTHKDVPTGGVP